MATIGVRDLFIARCTESATGETAGEETYGTTRRLAKAIKIELAVTLAEAVLHADDAVDETISEFVSGEIKINANDISDEDEAELLGQEADEDGVNYSHADDEPPYWAVGFRAKKASGKYTYVWLYKVKFKLPDETYDTKADGITFNTPNLTGTFIKRNKDGNWRAKITAAPNETVAQGWFSSVREKNDAA
jgi:phi13 family phage major tail protein